MIVKLLEVGIRLIWTQSTASITSNLTRSTIFFLFPCPHPRFVLKKEKEKKMNLNASHSFCTMGGKI